MQREIQQSTQPLRTDLWQAHDRRGVEHTIPHDAQPPRPFRNQDRAIGKKRHAERMNQSFRDRQPDLMLDGCVQYDRPVRKRRRRPIDARGRGGRTSRPAPGRSRSRLLRLDPNSRQHKRQSKHTYPHRKPLLERRQPLYARFDPGKRRSISS